MRHSSPSKDGSPDSADYSDAWFATLAPEIREDVLKCARPRLLAKGKCLFHRGDAPDYFYRVEAGSIRIGGTSSDGVEATLSIYAPGNWFGEIAMLDGGPRTHDAYAHVTSRLLQIGRSDFEQLLSKHAAFSRALLRLECMRLRSLLTGFEAFATQSLEQRLAVRLKGLIDVFGVANPKGVAIDLHLSQEIIAQLVGGTRQRVNQVLKQWEHDGWIVQSHCRIVVTNQAAIDELARF